jgi:hypothetical protein
MHAWSGARVLQRVHSNACWAYLSPNEMVHVFTADPTWLDAPMTRQFQACFHDKKVMHPTRFHRAGIRGGKPAVNADGAGTDIPAMSFRRPAPFCSALKINVAQ